MGPGVIGMLIFMFINIVRFSLGRVSCSICAYCGGKLIPEMEPAIGRLYSLVSSTFTLFFQLLDTNVVKTYKHFRQSGLRSSLCWLHSRQGRWEYFRDRCDCYG